MDAAKPTPSAQAVGIRPGFPRRQRNETAIKIQIVAAVPWHQFQLARLDDDMGAADRTVHGSSLPYIGKLWVFTGGNGCSISFAATIRGFGRGSRDLRVFQKTF